MNLEHVRRQLIVKAALILFVLISFATLVRPFMVSQPMTFTYLGVLDALITGSLYLYLSQNRVYQWHAYLVIAASFVAIVPVMYLSGGVYSHFAVVLPLAPVMVCLIAPARVAWWVAGLCIVILGGFYVGLPQLADPGGWQMAGDAKVRLLWLSLGCLMGAVFSAEFDRLSRHLTNASLPSSELDKITGVLGRNAVLDALTIKREKIVSQENWISVVMLQVCSLDRVRALYGELGVNTLLQSVAFVLRDSIRVEEDVVGRYSDDTFLLVLEHIDQCHAYRIAEKINENIAQMPVLFDNEQIEFDVSVGYCSLPGLEAHTDDMILKSANRALYAAKRCGQNHVVGAEASVVQNAS